MGAGYAEELIEVKILPNTSRYFQIRASMGRQDKVEKLLLLIQNVDVFAWSPYEVPKVDPEFIVHRLNVDPSFPPKKQKPRRSTREHIEAIKSEVQKLKKAGAIREIYFPEWLANTVVIKKKNIKWRVCVDFTDLNQACPKDPFPILKINQLVDSTYEHPRMSFLDAFQRYHQIALAPPNANCHYTVMPFGLKNAEATYQWMMTRMFLDKIGCTIEVYIDDMVVKSNRKFGILRIFRVCSKCSDSISYVLMLRCALSG